METKKKQLQYAKNNLTNEQRKSLRLSYFIVGVIAFSQGILGLSDLALNYLYKDDFHMSPAEVAMTTSIITLPWIFKPVWGIISDSIPLFGYRRKSYLIVSSLIGFLLWQCQATMVSTKLQGIIVQILINISVAFCNVIGEALIVEISQKQAKQLNLPEDEAQAEASKNVSMFFGVRSVGTLITAFLSGELLEIIGKKQIFAITSLFPLTLLFVAFFLEEKKQEKNLNKSAGEIKSSEIEGFGQFKKLKDFVSLPEIYKPILFIFLFMMMPSSGTSMFYFYTNELNFSPEFLGSLRFIYAVGSLSAVVIYNKFLKAVQFKKQFIATTIISVVLGYSQILLVTRDNLKLGIPDKLFTLGDSVIIQVMGEINTMPLLVLACRMCPKDIEGTMYALMMSTLNFGSIISGQLGGVLTYYFGVTETDFGNLALMVFITNSLQLAPLFLISMINTNKIKQIQENNESQILKEDINYKNDSQDESDQLLDQQSNDNTQADNSLFDNDKQSYLSNDQTIVNKISHEIDNNSSKIIAEQFNNIEFDL